MKIYVIRHGETNANLEGRLQGRLNVPLNDFGIKLATITGQAMQNIHFDIVYSSPLDRALSTAKIILSNSGNDKTNICLDDRLQEVNMGDWEGQYARGEKCHLPKEILKQFFANPLKMGNLPNGESAKEVCARTQEFFQELIQKQYENILVSTHGFAMRALLNPLYEDKNDFWQGHIPYNCAVNTVEVENTLCRLAGPEKIYYDKAASYDRYGK